MKRIIHNDQVRFIPWMQECFTIYKSINVIYNINRTKYKNHVIISVDTEKAFNKIQHPFMIKALNKATYNKLMVIIILNSERLKGFSLRSGRRQGCPL